MNFRKRKKQYKIKYNTLLPWYRVIKRCRVSGHLIKPRSSKSCVFVPLDVHLRDKFNKMMEAINGYDN